MKRRKHKWQQLVVFSCTDKQAKQAYTPDNARNRVLTPDDVVSSAVLCSVCTGYYPEVVDSFCPGEPTIEVGP